MAKKTWKVRLHIVNPDPAATKATSAEHVDTFGIEADGHDRARAAATAWLADRKYTVRAINFVAPKKHGDPPPDELIAYVLPLKKEAPGA